MNPYIVKLSGSDPAAIRQVINDELANDGANVAPCSAFGIFKFIVMIMVTFLLNALCLTGLSVVSWVIVFIPFILMTVIVSMLLYIFGLDNAKGKFDYDANTDNNGADVSGIIVINKNGNDVEYVEKDTTYNIAAQKQRAGVIPPYYSSDPSYESFK